MRSQKGSLSPCSLQIPGKPMIHLPQEGNIDPDDIQTRLIKANQKGADLSLGMVVNRPAAVPHDWGSKPEHFSGKRPSDRERKCKIWNGEIEGPKGRNRPRVWGASNEHIGESVAVWFEVDGGLPIEEQLKFHELIGLPEPSFTVWTGGKSLHCYYFLDVPCDPSKSHFLMDWIGKALKKANPDAGADESIEEPLPCDALPRRIPRNQGWSGLHLQRTPTATPVQR